MTEKNPVIVDPYAKFRTIEGFKNFYKSLTKIQDTKCEQCTISGAEQCIHDNCSICCEPMDIDKATEENLMYISDCNHVYHITCIKEWFARGSRECPLCKGDSPLVYQFDGTNFVKFSIPKIGNGKYNDYDASQYVRDDDDDDDDDDDSDLGSLAEFINDSDSDSDVEADPDVFLVHMNEIVSGILNRSGVPESNRHRNPHQPQPPIRNEVAPNPQRLVRVTNNVSHTVCPPLRPPVTASTSPRNQQSATSAVGSNRFSELFAKYGRMAKENEEKAKADVVVNKDEEIVNRLKRQIDECHEIITVNKNKIQRYNEELQKYK